MEKANNLSSYCNVNNFTKAVLTISEDLYIVGLPSIADFDSRNPSPCIVSLINTIWTLLQHRQSFVDSKRSLEQKVSALTNECMLLKEKQAKLEKDLLQSKEFIRKEKKISFSLKDEKSWDVQKLKCLRQEIQDLKIKFGSKELQYKNEIKKQQDEISVLKQKLQKILRKERGETFESFVKSAKCDFLEDIVRHDEICKKSSVLESNVHSLVQENLELKKLLASTNSDLAVFMSQTLELSATPGHE